jgi:hypothetical protein
MSSQYVVPPQGMPMNKRIGYDNANYLANYSQNSPPYANIDAHNSASYVTSNSSRINKNQQGVIMVILTIRLHMLLLALTESMKGG